MLLPEKIFFLKIGTMKKLLMMWPDGGEKTDHTWGTEESDDITMGDGTGESNTGFDEQDVTLKIWTHKI